MWKKATMQHYYNIYFLTYLDLEKVTDQDINSFAVKCSEDFRAPIPFINNSIASYTYITSTMAIVDMKSVTLRDCVHASTNVSLASMGKAEMFLKQALVHCFVRCIVSSPWSVRRTVEAPYLFNLSICVIYCSTML